MKKLTVMMIVSAFLLSACGDKTYSVEELKKDESLFKEVSQKCTAGIYKKDSQNCENAYRVFMDKQFGL